MVILYTMCKLIFALLIGVYLYRTGVFTRDTSRALSGFIAKITNPCLVIYSLSTVSNADPGVVLRLFAGGLVAYGLYFLFGQLFCRVFRIRSGLRGVTTCMIMFANYGFMGFPVVQSLYGNSAIFYLSMFNLVFNCLIYTFGTFLIVKDASASGDAQAKFVFNPKSLLSTGTVASVLALLIFFTRFPVPQVVYECTGFIGNVTMPLAMVVIGANMAASSFRDVKSAKGLVPLAVVRLAVIPLLIWCYMHLITDDPTIIKIVTVGAGMPAAALVSMISAPWKEQNQHASICVAVTTVLSMVTTPVLAFLLGA